MDRSRAFWNRYSPTRAGMAMLVLCLSFAAWMTNNVILYRDAPRPAYQGAFDENCEPSFYFYPSAMDVLQMPAPAAYKKYLAYPTRLIDKRLGHLGKCFHPDKRSRHSLTNVSVSMSTIWAMYKEAAEVAKLGLYYDRLVLKGDEQESYDKDVPIAESMRATEAAAKFTDVPHYDQTCPHACGLPEALARVVGAALVPYWQLPGNQLPPPPHVNQSSDQGVPICPPCTLSLAWRPWSFFLHNLPPPDNRFWLRNSIHARWNPRDMALQFVFGRQWIPLTFEEKMRRIESCWIPVWWYRATDAQFKARMDPDLDDRQRKKCVRMAGEKSHETVYKA